MQDPVNPTKATYSKNIEQKKTWYSPVANIYYSARPSYPQENIDHAVTLAQLNLDASILEIGCGPGNATVAFAKFGFSMKCIEPNQDFCDLVQDNCASYSNVTIYNTTFEEWKIETHQQFDAVLSANAFHWIPPEIRYIKAAKALKPGGSLILLWNMTPEPKYEIYEAIKEVYQAYAPSLVRYEGAKIQTEILNGFKKDILDSGCFEKLLTKQISCEVTYSIDEYLNLLSTLRKLKPQTKKLLFKELRSKLKSFGNNIQLSFLSAVHIAKKM